MSENYFDEDLYFESNNEGFLPPVDAPEIKEEEEKGKPFSGHKNKYINRIKNFSNNSVEGDQSAMNPSRCGDSSIKSLDKKERNKQAAKNSRDRKKLYIEIMQEKKRSLQKQLQSKKRQLEDSKLHYQRIVSQSKTMSNFAASRHQLIKRLETLLAAPEGQDPSKEINEIIDNLKSRIGATGKQRINTINEYFRQIVNLSLPALHRYMMWSAAEEKHLFSNDEEGEAEKEQWFRQLKSSLNLTQQQKKEIRKKQQFLKEQKFLLEDLIDQLKEVKNQIQKKSEDLDDIIDGIRTILSPIQCAKFILFIERNKYRKQLNLCEAINEDQFPKRKLVKREPN